MVFVSGQIPVNPHTEDIADTIEEQTEQVILNIKSILAEEGLTLAKCYKDRCIFIGFG